MTALLLALISNYSSHSITNTITVYPSTLPKNGDYNRIYDTSINLFCKQNDINYIEMQTGQGKNDPSIAYFLLDNNYQYVFNDKVQNDTAIFENTRVRVIPINHKWKFQYEKPNF